MKFQIKVSSMCSKKYIQTTSDNYYISTKIQPTFHVLFHDQDRVNKVIIWFLKLASS